MENQRPLGRGNRLAQLLAAQKCSVGEPLGVSSAPEPVLSTTNEQPKPLVTGGRGRRLAELTSSNENRGAAGEFPSSTASYQTGSDSGLPVSSGRGRLPFLGATSKTDSGVGSFGGRGRPLLSSSAVKTSTSEGLDIKPVLPTHTQGRGRPAPSTFSLGPPGPVEPLQSASDISADVARLKDLSISSGDVPSEPVVKVGTIGDKVNVTTNYISIETDPEKGVFMYSVKFDPTIDAVNIKYNLVQQHFSRKPGLRCYDGGSIMYLPERVIETEKRYKCTHPFDQTNVTVIVTFVKQLQLAEAVTLLNVLFNNVTRQLSLARLGKQYYNHKAAHIIPQHKLEIWPGYVTAVEEREGGVFVNFDLVHRVLRSETALDVIRTLSHGQRDFKDNVAKELLGQPVICRYNNRMYRIDDIEWQNSPSGKFEITGGKMVSFIEYYKNKYNIEIRDPKQPLLVSKAKKMKKEDAESNLVLLVPELCYMTGITDNMRRDFKVMKDVACFTRLTPEQRNSRLKQFVANVKANEKAMEMLKEWGIRIGDSAVELPARVLPSVKLRFGNNQQVVPGADWGRDVRSRPSLRVVNMLDWVVIYSARDEKRAKAFTSHMTSVGPSMGNDIKYPKMVKTQTDRITEIIDALQAHANAQIAVVIMAQARDDVYSAIKKKCLRELKLASQVVCSSTLAKENKMRAIVQNIALQMNCKLGGALWTTSIPIKNLMLCGIDSYHDPTRKSRSVGAFVASIDADYTSYFSKVGYQVPGEDLMVQLIPCFAQALRKYHQRNNSFPEVIIVYRDGVGDGQLKSVRDSEVQQIKSVFQSAGCQPKLVYVIVQKRIAARIYAKQGNGFVNAAPGTVLDYKVTKRNWYDFLIVAQKSGQGTVTPTHYVIIYDDAELKVDNLQRLTFALCHLYYNWPGTVRVPAPCLYAHKLAFLVGQVVKGVPESDFDDKLYYL